MIRKVHPGQAAADLWGTVYGSCFKHLQKEDFGSLNAWDQLEKHWENETQI